jgi:membrane protease YdiL (CAAX protease family)
VLERESSWSPAPIAWPSGAFRVFPTLMLLVGSFVLNIVVFILLILVIPGISDVTQQQLLRPHGTPVGAEVGMEVTLYCTTALFLFATIRWVARLSFAELGIRWPTRRELVIGVLGGVAGFLIFEVVAMTIALATHRHDVGQAVKDIGAARTPFERVAVAVVAVVFAPLVEELMFRVLLFNAIWRRTGFWTAAIVSSALFGFSHAVSPIQILTVGVPIGCSAIVLAYVYARTRCYWSNVITHAFFNVIGVAQIFLIHGKA